MERNNISNRITSHIVEIRTCPNCGVGYCSQHGGQKSGSSTVVHIPKVGAQPIGYCSTRCFFEKRGESMDEIIAYYRSMGIDYDEVFPPGYLAPSRKLENHREEVDSNG